MTNSLPAQQLVGLVGGVPGSTPTLKVVSIHIDHHYQRDDVDLDDVDSPGALDVPRLPMDRSVRRVYRLAPWIVFAAFTISISYRLTPNHGVLMYGDYPYYWPGHTFDPFSVVQSSFLGYVRLVDMQALPLMELPRLLSAILPANWISYLLTYGLLYLTCMTYYFVARKLTGSAAIGYVTGLFIILNQTVLEYLVVQPSHIFVALIVYALTLYLFHDATRKGFRARHTLILGAMSLAITHPLLWALELCLVAGLFLFLLFEQRQLIRHTLVAAAQTFGLIALLGSYWLVPFALGTFSSGTNSLYAGSQQSVFEGVRAKIHYLEGFDLFQYPGSWQNAIYGGGIPHLFYFATLAFVVGVFLFRGRRGPNRKVFLVLLALYLVALTLGLGPNSAATGRIWIFAYNHIPSFGFFRTFSRFITLALVAIVFLLAYALYQLHRSSFKYFPHVIVAFVVALLAAHWVFFTGNLNGTLSTASIPKEYASLNSKLLDKESDFSVITFPNVAYEAYGWSANSNQQAFQQIEYFKEFFLDQPVIFNRLALNDMNIKNRYFPRLFAYNSSFSFYSSFDSDLNKLDVKYVLVHKDLVDIVSVINNLPNLKSAADVHAAERLPYQLYMAYFSQDPNYKLVENNNVFAVYENEAFRPIIRASGVYFEKLNDSTYRVYLSNLKSARTLTLLQRFDSGWQIYPLRAPSLAWCRRIATYSSGLSECARGSGDNFVEAAARALGSGTLHVPHAEVMGYANEWRLDAHSVRKQFSAQYYSANPDGSINIAVLLYFRPQSDFYLGLIVTLLTMGGCLTAIGGLSVNRLRRKRAAIRHQHHR